MMMASTYEGEGPKCPYCGRQYTADDPGYYSDSYVEETCDQCGETFAVEVCTNVDWRCTTRDHYDRPPT
jgi:hypothetical protein